jgi:DNA-binding MarR family transcriptional regulator
MQRRLKRKRNDRAAQTPQQQEEMRALIDRLRAAMPGLLASLPIAKRRQLEELD